MRFLAAALALWAGSSLAEEVTTFQLDNGMDVVVIEDHRAPVVVHMLWYRAGSADEPVGSSGVAHYLEHLLFKATETVESGEFQRVVAENGGSDNAFTSYDYTGYFQRVAADRLPLMMQYEADRMNNLVLTEEDIRTELGVILEERNQRTENSPNALAREQMRAAQFLNHRYGVPIIGWKHEMEELDMQDALSFYDIYYSPNNAILVVAGDVEPDEVLALAEKYYGPLPAEPNLPERFRTQEPPQIAERRLIFEDPRVAQPYISRSYIAPERDEGAQEEAAALTYLADLLGGSPFTSALGIALQFETNTAVYAGAYYDGLNLDDGTFGLTVVPAEGVSLQDAEDAMDAAIAAFLEEGIDPARMEALRTQLKASEIYARDNVGGIARRYGAALTSGLTVDDVQAWPEILQAVTAEDVLAAAERVLDRDQSVTGWVIPSREVLQ
ncbi:pitrilysin family protein [Octadecabacter sp. 1_MG-2023]|uniref:M16 family metallopeptidase n=1 Tax=unclassified Octadecabacter TaxID=196158 RepID=UPI001C08D5DC|nr:MULTISPECIES: pitrilysin family protein [unclassified Octadecabacter]MBU2992103.1 insulinase family protein [Octadecabacter sp. B2R22]MDO6735140.1 pitrilysin family protein [Octadecabacter sp. 1_MG-2023]